MNYLKTYTLVLTIVIFLFANCSGENLEEEFDEVIKTNSSKIDLQIKPNLNLTNTTIINQDTTLKYEEEAIYDLDVDKDLNTPLTDDELFSWFGYYAFYEHAPPYINMQQQIKIYKENGEYFARITIDGYMMNSKRIRANVKGNKHGIDLIFDSSYLTNEKLKKGDKLISLKRDSSVIYTYWGNLGPLLSDNTKSGEVYFEKQDDLLSIWIGKYYLYEDDSNSVLEYEVEIEKLNNIESTLNITKNEELMILNAKVEGNQDDINLVFDEYGSDNKFGDFEKGDILLTFKRQGSKVYTFWGKFKPELDKNGESGKIYFVEEGRRYNLSGLNSDRKNDN